MPLEAAHIGNRMIIADEFAFDILLRRSVAIRNKQRENPDYELSCADLSGLKEMRKVAHDLDQKEEALKRGNDERLTLVAFDAAVYMNKVRNSDLCTDAKRADVGQASSLPQEEKGRSPSPAQAGMSVPPEKIMADAARQAGSLPHGATPEQQAAAMKAVAKALAKKPAA